MAQPSTSFCTSPTFERVTSTGCEVEYSGKPKFLRKFYYTTGHAGRRGTPSGQAGTYPLVGGCACARASCSLVCECVPVPTCHIMLQMDAAE
eukprot:5977423-Prymnesium_polylepis.1